MSYHPIVIVRRFALVAAVVAAVAPAANAARPASAARCLVQPPLKATAFRCKTHTVKHHQGKGTAGKCQNPYIPACRPNIGVGG